MGSLGWRVMLFMARKWEAQVLELTLKFSQYISRCAWSYLWWKYYHIFIHLSLNISTQTSAWRDTCQWSCTACWGFHHKLGSTVSSSIPLHDPLPKTILIQTGLLLGLSLPWVVHHSAHCSGLLVQSWFEHSSRAEAGSSAAARRSRSSAWHPAAAGGEQRWPRTAGGHTWIWSCVGNTWIVRRLG